jgi:hypothetical protein
LDPNAALGNARLLAALVIRASDTGDAPDGDTAIKLAEALQALDAWLSRGGFLPTDWQR